MGAESRAASDPALPEGPRNGVNETKTRFPLQFRRGNAAPAPWIRPRAPNESRARNGSSPDRPEPWPPGCRGNKELTIFQRPHGANIPRSPAGSTGRSAAVPTTGTKNPPEIFPGEDRWQKTAETKTIDGVLLVTNPSIRAFGRWSVLLLGRTPSGGSRWPSSAVPWTTRSRAPASGSAVSFALGQAPWSVAQRPAAVDSRASRMKS